MRRWSSRPRGGTAVPTAIVTAVLTAAVTTTLVAAPILAGPSSSGGAAARADELPPVVAPPAAPPVLPPVGDVPSTADERIAAQLAVRASPALLGPRLAGQVVDAESGRVVWAAAPDTALLPASVTKLTTAVIALRTLGPTARLSTRVVTGARPGQVVIVGAGDPTLSARQLRTLAAAAASRARAAGRRTVDVVVDDRLFAPPTLATGWPRSYYRGSIAPVRALQVGQLSGPDTSLAAAKVFAAGLRAAHLHVHRISRGAAPLTATPLAVNVSVPVGDMVAHMLSVSDNDYAEALLRLSAVRLGLPGSWAGARAAQLQVLTAAGIPLTGVRLYDGSGLSRADRIPPTTLVTLLRTVQADPAYATVLRSDALPTAAVSGSLRPARHRFTTEPASCARGNVRAKTGILHDVVTLAGYATGSDGRLKVFAFEVNGGTSSAAVRNRVDALAATVTGCW